MGNTQSDIKEQSPHFTRLSELFQHLAEVRNANKIIKQDSFEKYFTLRGSSLLGELLYRYINKDGKILNQNEFVNRMENVLNNGSSSSVQVEMYFAIFSKGQETITYQGLYDMVKVCYGMRLYLEGNDKSADEPVEGKFNIFEVIVHSMMSDESSPVKTKKCVEWTSKCVSCLFNPLHSWLVTLILHGQGKLQSCRQLHPIISWSDHPNMILSKHLFWLIAMILPDHYASVKLDNLWSSTHTASGGCISDKQWTVLYNSIQDGQSYNRFKHHCFSYNGPTVLIMMIQSGPIVVAAVDSNWRESSSSWGKSDCMLLQIDENIKILKEGENMVFLNERTRGFPTGLLLGNGAGKPIVSVNIDLTSAMLHNEYDATPRNITRLEVWGCSGLVAKEKQKEQQRWERQQAEKLQKVKLPGKWDENPDRAILEMAGITSNNYGETDR